MRTDIRLLQQDPHDFFEIGFAEDGDFIFTEGLDTALAISVLEEQRATVEEVKQPEFRRGWCGTEDNDFEQGSKLWLWEGHRRLQSTLNGAKDDTLTGLEWLLDDGLADEVTVSTAFDQVGLRLDINIESDGNETENTLYALWGGTNAIGE